LIFSIGVDWDDVEDVESVDWCLMRAENVEDCVEKDVVVGKFDVNDVIVGELVSILIVDWRMGVDVVVGDDDDDVDSVVVVVVLVVDNRAVVVVGNGAHRPAALQLHGEIQAVKQLWSGCEPRYNSLSTNNFNQ